VWVEKDGQPLIEMSGIETNTTFRSE